MLSTRLLICFGMMTLPTPALCTQFFIVHDPAANRCFIVEQPTTPSSGSVVVFGDGTQGDRPPPGSSGPVMIGGGAQGNLPPYPDSGLVPVGDGAYGDRPAAEFDMRRIAVCAASAR
jgi:hypothetical protein